MVNSGETLPLSPTTARSPTRRIVSRVRANEDEGDVRTGDDVAVPMRNSRDGNSILALRQIDIRSQRMLYTPVPNQPLPPTSITNSRNNAPVSRFSPPSPS